MNTRVLQRLRGLATLLAGCALWGCSALKPAALPEPQMYALVVAAPAVQPAPARLAKTEYALAVAPPQAAPGLDSRHIMYLREPGRPQYYAYNEWVETPARMLAPLIVSALERSGVFRAVASTPSTAAADLRLETQVLSLQQEFFTTPSRVRFALRAELLASDTRRILATREFESVVAAASDNPQGGVDAAQLAVSDVLRQLTAFCAQQAADRGGQRRAHE